MNSWHLVITLNFFFFTKLTLKCYSVVYLCLPLTLCLYFDDDKITRLRLKLNRWCFCWGWWGNNQHAIHCTITISVAVVTESESWRASINGVAKENQSTDNMAVAVRIYSMYRSPQYLGLPVTNTVCSRELIRWWPLYIACWGQQCNTATALDDIGGCLLQQ